MTSTIVRACLGVTLLLGLDAATLAAQEKTAASNYMPPTLPNGQPNFEGYWGNTDNVTPYSLERGDADRAEHVAITGQRTATGRPIVDPPNGLIPFQPWAQKRYQHLFDAHTGPTDILDLDPVARGFVEGTPRIIYQSGFQVLQPDGFVILLYEYGHHYRVIPLDDRPHLPSDMQLWMGDSRGHWEGNTLVVDVTNHNDQTWLDQVGAFHSNALHVVERYTFVGENRVNYLATLEDPLVYATPWTIGLHLRRNADPTYEQMESATWEGNRSVEFMMRTPPNPAAKTAGANEKR